MELLLAISGFKLVMWIFANIGSKIHNIIEYELKLLEYFIASGGGNTHTYAHISWTVMQLIQVDTKMM